MATPRTIELKCINCGLEKTIPYARRLTGKYCSQRCTALWNRKHNRVSKICTVCGNGYTTPKTMEHRSFYCSKQCKSIRDSKNGSVIQVCVVCGAETKKCPSDVVARPTCSNKCRGISQRKAAPPDGTRYRRWYKIHWPMEHCERCDYSTYPEILVIHHKDRDRSNNNKENLEVLCPNCHAVEHYKKQESSASQTAS